MHPIRLPTRSQVLGFDGRRPRCRPRVDGRARAALAARRGHVAGLPRDAQDSRRRRASFRVAASVRAAIDARRVTSLLARGSVVPEATSSASRRPKLVSRLSMRHAASHAQPKRRELRIDRSTSTCLACPSRSRVDVRGMSTSIPGPWRIQKVCCSRPERSDTRSPEARSSRARISLPKADASSSRPYKCVGAGAVALTRNSAGRASLFESTA